MSKDERDTHFQGVARLLTREMKGHIINICDVRAMGGPPDMYYAQIEQLLARRAYDFAKYIYQSTGWDRNPFEVFEEEVTRIPDMRQWTRESE